MNISYGMLNDFNEQQIRRIVEIFEKYYIQRNAAMSFKSEEKWKWFNDVLSDFKEFGFNSFATNYDAIGCTVKMEAQKKEVSINRFCFIEINAIYIRAICQQFPHEKHWSHPVVISFLKYIIDGDIKRFLYQEHILKQDMWIDIKLFANMVYGSLNTPRSNLKLDSIFYHKRHLDICNDIIHDLLIKTKQIDNVVTTNIDSVLLSVPKTDLLQLSIEPWKNFISLHDDVHELNRVCRKFKIDIVK